MGIKGRTRSLGFGFSPNEASQWLRIMHTTRTPNLGSSLSQKGLRAQEPRSSRQAATHLGPFKYQAEAEALSNQFTYKHHNEDWAISKELALRLTSQAAKRFNKDLYLSEGAPRFKHVLEAIRRVQHAADSLCAELNSLDDISRHELQFYKPINLNEKELRSNKENSQNGSGSGTSACHERQV